MNDKEKILQTLKDFGRLATWRVAAIIGRNPQATDKALNELLEEKKVKQIKVPVEVYWEIVE